ncbi:NAC domain-containing protein 90-like [Chenopodium quinoa]|uniref:NAC domain-containing protein n=1 Tax=Chenopodium quinoa TaxID=63459 RepID=A0A803L2Y4_CHEQI|nr:NAC domain-containing protein 90-like [Chenopodium quinoa]
MEAPGFRFYPTEEELISFYLQQKLQGRGTQDIDGVIPVVYIYDYNPWDLPQLSGKRCRNDPQLQEWFFFIPKQEREANGGRPNRLTTLGYWKATGSPSNVYSSNKVIGIKRTMVFYRGRARSRSGSKTDWKMNEYIAIDDQSSSSTNPAPSQKGEFTVCRVYIKSKSLRAFDRRPAAPPPPPMNRPVLVHQVDNDQPSSSEQARSRVETRRWRSSESSSSSGGHHQAAANNNNNTNDPSRGTNYNNNDQLNILMDMEVYDQQELLWEWDDSWMNNF